MGPMGTGLEALTWLSMPRGFKIRESNQVHLGSFIQKIERNALFRQIGKIEAEIVHLVLKVQIFA